ncbi:molybdate ABC transporter substrate-binding protein [Halobacillus salinarum]|uniref:Molybdate ABC transporter substrate-binding protein n=1 Tax=Halobacillus salinarum TaxID=2932257 RepID=A0ABY4EKV9_9BACI|nr:molybdate ABC transporter substrate-binding protein [Halobacillus salinarum]UOQ44716.1 molybdate ABC transporter substrate-binding protein [Halobacillus salinarum]
MKRCIFLLLIIVMIAGCSNPAKSNENTELTISAAASLTDAVKDLKDQYEKKHPNVSIQLNLASSGKLAQQIQQGAPADVYLSANQRWMDTLEDDDKIDPDSRFNFTKNTIVLIGLKNNSTNVKSFQDLKPEASVQLAVGDPDSVPAGKYTKETLQTIQKWDKLKEQFVYGSDVRQVLAYVESGNAKLGFVYGSDAKISDKVKVMDQAEDSWHSPIIYPAAIVKDSKAKKEAQSFLDYLKTDAAQETLQKYGFKK